MLELKNIPLALDLLLSQNKAKLYEALAARLQVSPEEIASVTLLKKSVDARKKSDVHFVATVGVCLQPESLESEVLSRFSVDKRSLPQIPRMQAPERAAHKPPQTDLDVRIYTPKSSLSIPVFPDSLLPSGYQRPIVVGSGPAGLFAALYLARCGLRPLLIERGGCVEERVAKVEAFNATGEFDPVTNIQFGEGGAGTFSDGKLTTGTKNPLIATVLDWFVEAGAPAEIKIEAKPHIGTDKLRDVVVNLRQRIERLGGQVRFHTCLTDFEFEQGRLCAVIVQDALSGQQEKLPATQVILATGHSARDTFSLVSQKGLAMERKPFSVGVRIEHPQSMINQSQYGAFARHPALGAADYKLSTHLKNGRGVYTFCMCPGGQVVAAASEEGGVVVNGMSVHARDGRNANSAVLVAVEPDDLPGSDVLEGVRFQRNLEQAAYRLAIENGGAPYSAPAQRVGDFLAAGACAQAQAAQRSKKQKKHLDSHLAECETVEPSYPRGVAWCDLHECLPPFVSESLEQALPEFDRRIQGFAAAQAVMTGVETRSSSPIRVLRDAKTLQASFAVDATDAAAAPEKAATSPQTGVFPCGEGAGYAGGIMSAAVDGLRVAQAVIEQLCPDDFDFFEKHAATAHGSEKKGADQAESGDSWPVREFVDEQGNRYEYQQLSEKSVVIRSCLFANDTVVMPSFIDGKLVARIDSGAFSNAERLESLALSAGVDKVEARLLRSCTQLKILALPDALRNLDVMVLRSVPQIEELRLPAMLQRIPSGLFRACSPRVLVLGKGTRKFSDSTFEGSSLCRVLVDEANPWLYSDGLALYRKHDHALTALAVPVTQYRVKDGCTRIRRKAFSGMEPLCHVDLPESIQAIESFAFFRTGLESFQAPAGLRSISDHAFFHCENLAQVRLNEGLQRIGKLAFERTAVDAFFVPASVQDLAADFCGDLRECQGETRPIVSLDSDNPYYLMDDQRALYSRMPEGLRFERLFNVTLTSYVLRPETVEVAPYAFAALKALTHVTLSDRVEVLGNDAFSGCSALLSVEGSNRLCKIGAHAFAHTQLQRLHLPKTLSFLGKEALILEQPYQVKEGRAIPCVEVHAENARFFVENDFLCERENDGGVSALLYLANGTRAEMPSCVTNVRAHCFINAGFLETLLIHDGIRSLQLNCFLTHAPLYRIDVALDSGPVQGHRYFHWYFSSASVGKRALRNAFAKGVLDYAEAFSHSDTAVYWLSDLYAMASISLQRLLDPIYLDDQARARFESVLKRRLLDVADLFARHNYLEGFEGLIELGFITKDNIVQITDHVTQSGSVEATAHLFELRRRYYGYDVLKEYDL